MSDHLSIEGLKPHISGGQRNPAKTVLKVAAGIAAVLLLLLLLAGLTSVDAYESCLFTRNGSVEEQWNSGLHWALPVGSDVACFRTARSTYEASPGESGGGAEFNDDAVDARTGDGQRIDAVSFRIAFHVPQDVINNEGDVVDANNLEYLYTVVGANSTDDLVATVVAFYARPEVRAVIQLQSSQQLLEGDWRDLNKEIEDRLRPKFTANGIVLESVEISKIDFNDDFELKIQERQQAEIDTQIAQQQSQSELQKNQGQIDIDRENAQAASDRKAVESAAEAASIVTIANAEATAIAIEIEALGGPESYLQVRQIEAMSEWPVQIIGDTQNSPMIQIEKPEEEPSS